ncbi:MAG: hypothetical protein JKY65_28285, partial [Planctomycetes bacterium]|nr:hypothetical protein [Planctomycetota bacterium]
MNRTVALAVALLLALAAGLVWVVGGSSPPTQATSASAQPTSSPLATPTSSRVAKPGPTANPEDLGAALDGFLGAVPVRVPRPPAEILADTLAKGTSLIDYRKSLEDTFRRQRGSNVVAARLLADGLGKADERLRFQHALALSHHLDAATTDALLAGLA